MVGKRELAAAFRHASADQVWVVTSDAANAVRAIVALDRRYQTVPGYLLPLEDRARLGVAAVTVAAMAAEGDLDQSIDGSQWRQAPRPEPVTAPGIAGAVQAQHNLAVYLGQPPSARSLREDPGDTGSAVLGWGATGSTRRSPSRPGQRGRLH